MTIIDPFGFLPRRSARDYEHALRRLLDNMIATLLAIRGRIEVLEAMDERPEHTQH